MPHPPAEWPWTAKDRLGRFTNTPIVDMTDLKGSYDVRLEGTPLNRTSKKGAEAAAEPEGPTLFDALPEQAGLKLQMRKVFAGRRAPADRELRNCREIK
jgi:uncharacterized protein (TIGR03435 family)